MNSTVARLIAERLAAADDHDLAKLFTERRLSPTSPPASSWGDFFDAAETLLQHDAIVHAVSALGRDDLAALTSGSPLRSLTLTDDAGLALPGVLEAIGDADISPTPTSTPLAAEEVAAGHAAERAFTTITALADIMIQALTAPLARVGTGAMGAADRRHLAEQQIVQTPEEAEALMRLASATGLMRGHERRIHTTEAGAAWVQQSTPARWAELAERLRDALPAALRTAEGGWIDPALWPDAYPLDETWPDKARGWIEFARLVGLVADGEQPAEPTWATTLRRGSAAEPTPLVVLLPHEVENVYLQNDLTAISPGPLAPALDVRLRRMAVRESHAQASTYRFTEASISRALSAGETSETVHEFLERLSLTGVPQPLDYLLHRAADRHGLIRVSLDPTMGHTVVSSRDHDLVRTLSVDQSLQAIGLVLDGAMLRSRAPRDAVYWALADARYPVVAIDDAGDMIPLDRHRLAPAGDAAHDFADLISRLHDGQGGDADAAWMDRELDTAIKDRATLAIEVNMPDGSVRELTLEATGLGGGRLRGRDAKADVERTLPVSLIRTVRRL
ncbi:helicase-associated domain-containing protein [Microbacterium sp. G2-8]|uniref:helicase-associated domain-containing protein n=1 Tax=Microbacterium sp. G2-8 TaxID=2842454 RepID=UPI001C89263D|nr:helicase-associated domain-containing protein [Microbacterium sp. G2-8]